MADAERRGSAAAAAGGGAAADASAAGASKRGGGGKGGDKKKKKTTRAGEGSGGKGKAAAGSAPGTGAPTAKRSDSARSGGGGGKKATAATKGGKRQAAAAAATAATASAAAAGSAAGAGAAGGSGSRKRGKGTDNTGARIQKRPAPRSHNGEADIYVNRTTDFAAQLARAQKLLDGGHSTIYIHGLGAAINRAINLALQLQERSNGSIQLSTNTSTVALVDDIEPDNPDALPTSQIRNNSAVHITISRIA